jgi:hypothetical protein
MSARNRHKSNRVINTSPGKLLTGHCAVRILVHHSNGAGRRIAVGAASFMTADRLTIKTKITRRSDS